MTPLNNDLSGFVDRLIEEKELGGLDDETLLEVKNDLYSRAEERINATILAHLPPESLEEFSALLDGEDAGAIQDFCAKNIPDLDQLLAAALLDFRATYIAA